MGIRIEYWEIPKSDIKKAIIEDFGEMEQWYIAVCEEFPEDIDYDLLQHFEFFTAAGKVFEQVSHETANEIALFYLGDFCDYGPGKIREIKDTGMLNIRNYISDERPIRKKCSPQTTRLWQFLLKGRSINDPEKFINSPDVYSICILSESECQHMAEDLNTQFDTTTPTGFKKYPGIGSFIDAVNHKKGTGMLVTVA